MDIERIREANPIVEVIGEEVRLRKAGVYWRGEEHDSLVVDPARGAWFWNAQGKSGDVFTWVEWRRKTDFRGAVEWLCSRAKLEPPRWSGDGAAQAVARRATFDALTVACRHFVQVLQESAEGMAYCQGRGWTEETIRKAGLGYYDGDRKALEGELSMHGIREERKETRAVLGIPAESLVYAHVWGGRVVYFSTRLASREEKRHWNPPAEMVGARQAYYNHVYSPTEELVVVVEGQADAVTLGQWGIAAVALAGVTPSGDLLQRLGKHSTVVLGLDQDGAGKQWTTPLANALGPLTRLVAWPAHDANDWLQAGGTAEEALALLQGAEAWVERLARRAGEVEGLEREEGIRQVFRLVARMEDFEVAMRRQGLARSMGLALRTFNAMVKAARGESAKAAEEASEEGLLLEVATPGGKLGDYLVEMIVVPPEATAEERPSWRTRFACRGTEGEAHLADYVDVDGVRYVPVSSLSKILRERVVQFPTALGERLEMRELVARVRKLIHRYVDIDVFYEFLTCYYVLFTWLFDAFNTLPYLRLLGDAGTGKSRFLQVVGALCYRPMFVNGAATVSPVFRLLDVYRGTLVLDEADYRNSDEASDIIKILNTGYQRVQGVVLRSGDKNTGFETEVFVTYGPKLIATRKKFVDWALESRCLTYETGGPTTRIDIPIDLPRSFWTEEAPAVRNLLLRYRLENWQPEIELDYSRLDVQSVEPRLNQVTAALLTLIEDDDLANDLRGFIQEYNRQLVVERGMTLTAKVLDAVVGLQGMTEGTKLALSLKSIAAATNILIDVENAEHEVGEGKGEEDGGSKKSEKNENRVKARKIGSILRRTLHLTTERGAQGRAYQMLWDQERIDALRRRFGMDDDWLQRTVEILREHLEAEQYEF